MKLGLRKKIFLSYMVLIVILVLISTLAVRHLMRLNRINDLVIKTHYESIFTAQKMLHVLEQHQRSLWLLTSDNIKQRSEADEIFTQSKDEFFIYLQEIKLNAKIEGEDELAQKIESYYLVFLDNYSTVQKNLDTDKLRLSLYRDTSRLQLDNLRQLCLALLEKNRDAMFDANKQAQDLSVQYISSMLIFSALAVILGIGLSIWLTHVIVGPVEDLTRAVNEIQKGNYDIMLETNLPDEIGLLAEEFNKMTITLTDYKKINLQKLIEEKRRTEAIIRSVGDCMIVIDKHFKIIMVNPTTERVFYLLPGISHGRDFRDAIKSEDLYNIIKKRIENEPDPSTSHTLPTFVWEYNREKKHFQVKVFPVTNEEGTHIGYVILLEDVTKLKELDQMKNDFISIASHELRTPLTSIVMSLGLLLEGSAGDLTKDQQELLEAANEEAARMRDLMTNLLDLSRIETGRMEMEFVDLHPQILLNSIASSFSLQCENNDIQMNVDVPDDISLICADYNKIMQVLNNLVGNAFRYTPPGGKINLSAKNQGDMVLFSVEDTGSGIPKELQDKIFEKFVQIENDPKRGGAGLGLAVSREIIKAHKGKIWVESEMNKGAKFFFLIPSAIDRQDNNDEADNVLAGDLQNIQENN